MWLCHNLFEVILFLVSLSVKLINASICGPSPITCPPITDIYRNFDGTCNNLNNPIWGASGTLYSRLGKARFDTDGVSIRKSACTADQDLPGARHVRLAIYKDDDISVDFVHPRMYVSCLKFLAADMGNLDIYSAFEPCCTRDMQFVSNPPSYCSYIPIPSNDPVYTEVDAKCMSVIKGVSNIEKGCSLGSSQAEFVSQGTFWIDMSPLYGSSVAENKAVRKFSDGELYMEQRNGHFYLRNITNTGQCDIPPGSYDACYQTGDPNGNRFPDFTTFLTLATRQHNRIAAKLKNMNSCWDEEKIYQETRKIHIAQYQSITYYQMFPNLLGKQNMIDAGLIDPYCTTSNTYDCNCSPNAPLEYSHAALKGLHTMAQESTLFMDEDMHIIGSYFLRDRLTRPGFIEEHSNMDNTIRGFCGGMVNSVGGTVNPELVNHLDMKLLKVASDWLATDIHRNRLLGMPSYNDIREIQGKPRAAAFSDLCDVMTQKNIDKLSAIYNCVDDVELHAGILEIPVPGSIFGPTFQKIVLDQLLRTKNCDRFWFEFPSARFTEQQVQEIKKKTLARILCDNGNNIQHMQADVMTHSDTVKNPIIDCNLIPDMNYYLWKDPECSC